MKKRPSDVRGGPKVAGRDMTENEGREKRINKAMADFEEKDKNFGVDVGCNILSLLTGKGWSSLERWSQDSHSPPAKHLNADRVNSPIQYVEAEYSHRCWYMWASSYSCPIECTRSDHLKVYHTYVETYFHVQILLCWIWGNCVFENAAPQTWNHSQGMQPYIMLQNRLCFASIPVLDTLESDPQNQVLSHIMLHNT